MTMAKFFLVEGSHGEAIVRALKRYAEEHALQPGHFPYPALIQQAPTISLSELHVFCEADGSQFEVCGWGQEDALQRTSPERWRKQPLTWIGCHGVPWPGLFGSVNLRPWPEGDEAADVEAAAQTVRLYLGDFCDENVPPGEMITHAVCRAAHHIAELERRGGQEGPAQEAEDELF